MNKNFSPKNWLIVDEYSQTLASIESLKQLEINILLKKDLEENKELRFSLDDKICILSETSLELVLKRLNDWELIQVIRDLKNKVKSRKILQNLYPDFYFKFLTFSEILNFDVENDKKYVIKPVKGCGGIGVRIIDSNTDLNQLTIDIRQDLKNNIKFYPDSVLSEEEFLIEEFIEGEEYAVDMFYSETGEPVIINIYHHPLPKKWEYLDTLYYTCQEIFNLLYDKLLDFFEKLNQIINVESFPIHAEFKFDGKRVIPIELNPLRFGGCGLSDLAYYAFNFNPFEYFYFNNKPNWDVLWKQKQNKIYAWVLGYNDANIDIEYYRPNWRKFRNLFSHILGDVVFNYKDYLGFSVMYIEEDDIKKIQELVNIDFQKFFIGSQAYSDKSYWEMYHQGHEVNIPTGVTLWRQGDYADYLILVLEGMLEIVRESSDSQSIVLDTVEQGSAVGELSVLDGLPRLDTVRTKTPCTVRKISGSDFRKLIYNSPDLLEDLFWQQVYRLRKLNR
ncbi:hypothetical protein BZZ01_23975 [Nostocales cyanobacterium HT-58-2]|nr:hypothetical protein BZZ01_23975 [Nostocales cyanobacterium HT-58-2]